MDNIFQRDIERIQDLYSWIFNEKGFLPTDIKDILAQKSKILIEDDMKDIITDINKKSKNENIIIFIDSNIYFEHAINIKGVLEKNLLVNKMDKSIDLSYIPINENYAKKYLKDIIEANKPFFLKNNIILSGNLDKDYQTLKKFIHSDHLFILKEISNQIKDKNIYINESFATFINKDYINIDKNNPFNIFSKELIGEINKIKDENNELIKILNDNPKIFIAKAAGNYSLGNREQLLDIFNKITNNDLNDIKTLCENLNLVIEKKISGENIEKQEIVLKEYLEEILKVNNVTYNDFMNLYILDYLSNFQGDDLMKKDKELKNNNLKLVEAIDEKNLNENYKNYIKYQKKERIKELEDYFKEHNSLNYDIKDINRIKSFYNENKEKYPETFELTRFSSISSTPYLNSKIIEREVHGHNQEKIFNGNIGTSLASPQYLVNKVIENKKSLELDLNNIER